MKESIHGEDTTIINIFTQKNSSPKYIKQKVTDSRGEIDGSTIIVGDFSIPLAIELDSRSIRNRGLANIVSQLDLIDKWKDHVTLQQQNTHGTFSNVDHMFNYKSSFNKF